jgi:hypothetical protein
MEQSHSKASTSPGTSPPTPFRGSGNTSRLRAGQYGVVVRLPSGGRQCVLCARGCSPDCESYFCVFIKKSDVVGGEMETYVHF